MDTTPAPSTSPPLVPRRNWWSRNWKWFVPTGCLTLFVLFCAFIAFILVVAFGALKSTDVYRTAVQRAKSNSAVTAALGSPVKEGMFLSGNINANVASGNADLAIPVSGPKGSGTIYVVATKTAGTWVYHRLEMEVASTKQRINLNENDSTTDDDDE